MTVDTTPLEKTIEAWRELNASRVEALGNDSMTEVVELDHDEVFRLRDIAGEAMQLVDELKIGEPQQVWVSSLEAHGPDGGDYSGWVSVHSTEAGARKVLESRAAEWGLDLEAIDSGEDQSGSTYMLCRLPVRV